MTEPVIKCWYAFPYEVSDCNTVIMLLIWEEATRRTIFLSQEASKTAMVQRLWLLTRPGLVTAHWGMSMESSLDLGMSLPSTARHSGHEMPPKHSQTSGHEGALLTGSRHWPAASAKMVMTTTRCWPSTPLERSSGWRSETRHSVLWEKPGRTGLQRVKCFQVKIFKSPNSCLFSYLEKH